MCLGLYIINPKRHNKKKSSRVICQKVRKELQVVIESEFFHTIIIKTWPAISIYAIIFKVITEEALFFQNSSYLIRNKVQSTVTKPFIY